MNEWKKFGLFEYTSTPDPSYPASSRESFRVLDPNGTDLTNESRYSEISRIGPVYCVAAWYKDKQYAGGGTCFSRADAVRLAVSLLSVRVQAPDVLRSIMTILG